MTALLCRKYDNLNIVADNCSMLHDYEMFLEVSIASFELQICACKWVFDLPVSNFDMDWGGGSSTFNVVALNSSILSLFFSGQNPKECFGVY